MSSGVPAARLIPCSSPHTVAASSRPMVGWITSPLLRSIMLRLPYSNGRWPLRRPVRWLPSSLFTVTLGGCLGGDRSSVHPARGSGPPPCMRFLLRRSSVQPARGSGPPPPPPPLTPARRRAPAPPPPPLPALPPPPPLRRLRLRRRSSVQPARGSGPS